MSGGEPAREAGKEGGYVYFIRQAVTGLTKIGLAKDPWRRFDTLQREYGGLQLWLTVSTTDTRATERWFHRLFQDEHSYLEWFRLEPSQLNKTYLRFLAGEERLERRTGTGLTQAIHLTQARAKATARTKPKRIKTMNINTAFASKYLSASDCENDDGDAVDVILTIKKVTQETVGQGEKQEIKPVIWFRETEKGMVLNKTNAKTIASLHGAETDEWRGKRIAVFQTQVDFAGTPTMAVRVRLKAPKGAPVAVAAGPAADDDEDPFADE